MNRLMPFLGFAIICGGLYLFYFLIAGVGSFIASIDSDVGKQIVAVSGAVMIAAITVVLGQNLKTRAEIRASLRERKIEVYERFIEKLMETFYGAKTDSEPEESDDLVDFLQKFQTDLIMRGDKWVLKEYVIWKDKLLQVNADSVFATDELIKAIRKDLGFSNFGLDKGFFTHFWLRSSKLFLEMAKTKPNLTLQELAKIEEKLQEDA